MSICWPQQPTPAQSLPSRPRVLGKSLWIDAKKVYTKGVTYGPFRDGSLSRETVARDFTQMTLNRVNAIRTFSCPPTWLLDMAAAHGIRVMVGIAWEQHIHFLDDRRLGRSIAKGVEEAVRSFRGHPAVLSCAVGNEIPASIVRSYGPRKVENFIRRLYETAKAVDPELIVTYVNYPTTEYLELPFLELVAFNVYLEEPASLNSYVARLQHIAGERPLILSEIGLDSVSKGRDTQALILEQEIRVAFRGGCAGVFIFSWTDEWFRGGCEIEDWAFGLTDRRRTPKPALQAVESAFKEVPSLPTESLPRVSVVVCVRDGAATIEECLGALQRLNYPDYKVIVVDDGSTDETAALARRYDVKLISTDNRGLSSARNTGIRLATGELVAYLDADAYPDPDWLAFLVHSLNDPRFGGTGGPNIAPDGSGRVAECVALAPGGPQHILLDDRTAEHIPGCNMCFRREALLAIGGFDPRFRIAGDDVDLCWRLQEKGWELAFSPGAVVWHHPRSSVRGYWRQQLNYGKAEAMLAEKWPDKFNRFGHLAWRGRLYGNGPILLTRRVSRIYHGVWGTRLFQNAESAPPTAFSAFLYMPECWLAISVLAGASLSSLLWVPLFQFFLAILVVLIGTVVIQAARAANQACFRHWTRRSVWERIQSRLLTTWLYLIQPPARLWGRVSAELERRRDREHLGLRIPRSSTIWCWSESAKPPAEWLTSLVSRLRQKPVLLARGGPYDRWDLEVWCGFCGGIRLLASVEEHGGGKQMLRFALQPRFSWTVLGLISVLTALLFFTAFRGALPAFVFLLFIAASLVLRTIQESAGAHNAVSTIAEEWNHTETRATQQQASLPVKGHSAFAGEAGQ